MTPEDRRPDPDRALIQELWNHYKQDLFLDEKPSGVIVALLDLDDEGCEILEEWIPPVRDEERAWLTAYAGLCAVLRYVAYDDPSQASETVRRYATGRAWRIDSWKFADAVESEDVVYRVEVLGTMYGNAESAYLHPLVPAGLTVGDVGEPIALLVKYLTLHADELTANVCRAAFAELVNHTDDTRLSSDKLADRLDAQIEIPRLVMKKMRRGGVIRPYEQPDGSDSAESL